MKKSVLEVEGMSCGHCSNAVKNLIEEVEGVQSATIDLTSKKAEVEFDDSTTTLQAIIESVNSSEIYKATQK